jgi:hypothetical protein
MMPKADWSELRALWQQRGRPALLDDLRREWQAGRPVLVEAYASSTCPASASRRKTSAPCSTPSTRCASSTGPRPPTRSMRPGCAAGSRTPPAG